MEIVKSEETAPTPVEVKIPSKTLEVLRKLRLQSDGLTRALGQTRADYLGREATLVRQIAEAQKTFAMTVNNLLISAEIDVDAADAWDIDLVKGIVTKG